jgi:peroxiredoxin
MAWSVASVSDSTILAFVSETGVEFPVFRDSAATYYTYDQVGQSAPFPLDVVIDKNGVVRYVSTRYEPDRIAELVAELRAE